MPFVFSLIIWTNNPSSVFQLVSGTNPLCLSQNLFHRIFASFKYFLYLCTVLYLKQLFGGVGRRTYIWERRTWRFVLDILESGSSISNRQEHGNKVAHGYVLSDIADSLLSAFMQVLSFTYISAWASALLVQRLGRCQSLGRWDG